MDYSLLFAIENNIDKHLAKDDKKNENDSLKVDLSELM